MKNNTTEEPSALKQLKALLFNAIELGSGNPDCPCPICHIKRMVADGQLDKLKGIQFLREMMGIDDFLCKMEAGVDKVFPKIEELATFLSEQGFEKDAELLHLFVESSRKMIPYAKTFLVNEKNAMKGETEDKAEAAASFGINIAG